MEEIRKMATREGFKEVFWKRLRNARGLGKPDSLRQIYERMEDEYMKEYGRELFPSFGAFKLYFYRHSK